jgi:hypothetical protein
MNNGAPHCPKDLTLQVLIQNTSDSGDEQMEEINNALRYLYNFLSARKGYQRKMQIRRRVLTKYAKEHGFDREIDDAVKAMHGNVMEAASLDDVEDLTVEGNDDAVE